MAEQHATLIEEPPRETGLSFDERIDRLAQIAVKVGVNLAAGQELVITAPVHALALTRRITQHAYRAGAALVTTLFQDDEAKLLRFRYAPDESFDRAANWLDEGIAAAYRSGAARLAISGADPALLSGQDTQKVARANRAQSKASRPALELITRYEINWSIVPCATEAWARAVFPKDPAEVAIERLWDAIFAITRVDAPDPIEAWRAHCARLEERVEFLNAKRFSALHYRGPGTDLKLGLADDHVWLGGSSEANNGIVCVPNVPTEEVFSMPHKLRVDGVVRSTKPLSYQGMLIDDICVRFEGGRIVEMSASKGEPILRSLIETDEGAARLGEVALVPQSSPIAKSGLLFWNTLFDENAASHIALGQAYSSCVRSGETLEAAQLAAKGANESLIHVDWMVGSPDLEIDGITAGGRAEPLMRRGEWA